MKSSSEQGGEFLIDKADLTPQVLCFPFPEVRETLNTLRLPEEFLLPTLTPSEAEDMLLTGGYTFEPGLVIPEDSRDSRGLVDFEAMHTPVINRIALRQEMQLPGLAGFEHRYPVAGSSMSIHLLMAEWSRKAIDPMTELAVIEGEYDGYAFSAAGLNLPVYTVASLEEAGEPVKGRIWFVSNPSATDGNWHDQEAWQEFIAAGHDVVYDAAYVDLTADEHPLDVSADNIKAVITTPSKAFGVFWNRLTGVTYTREPIISLIDTMWFKNVPALMDTLMLYETFEANQLPRQYSKQQQKICQALGELVGKDISPSDTLLLAHTDESLPPEYSHFSLGSGRSRFRLSTLFARLETWNQANDL